jgi:hypothetical protein
MSLRAVLPVAVVAIAALALAGPTDAAQRGQSPVEKRDEYAVPPNAGPPVLALVSLLDQRVTIYDANGPILHSPVSSGQTGLDTPVGIYSVLQKEAEHYSNKYDDAAMPHMERITWSGVALHGGALPGYAASHGCVRLPYNFAERLFGLTKLGMRVIVSRYDVSPSVITHPLLFKPAPLSEGTGLVTKTAFGLTSPQQVNEARATQLQAIIDTKKAAADEAEKKAVPLRAVAKEKTAAGATALKALKSAERARKNAGDNLADAEKALTRAKTPKATDRAQAAKDKAQAKVTETQAKLDAVRTQYQPQIDAYEQATAAVKAVEAEKAALIAEAHDARRKMSPVSVFISLKTQKLYVRQAFEPVFEVPVTIKDPNRPIGTHTYTAVDYAEGGHEMRWNVVSIGGRRANDEQVDDVVYDEYERPRRHRAPARSSGPTPTDVGAASAALDRITIPQDAVERISELVLPGSSLIVSDEEASKETGQQTDFIVLISSEPQGGIQSRPRQDPYYDDYYGEYGGYYDNPRNRNRRGPFGGRGLFGFW